MVEFFETEHQPAWTSSTRVEEQISKQRAAPRRASRNESQSNWLLSRRASWDASPRPFTSTESQIAAFKKVVPDALDAQGWFAAKGQWADGTKFEP